MSGLADRLLTHVAQLFWAVLSGRAIQFLEWGAVSSLEPALRPRCVDWRLPRGAHPRKVWHFLFENGLCSECLYAPVVVNETWGFIPSLRARASITRLYEKSNLSAWPPALQGVPHLLDTGVGGKLRMLWKNEHHADALGAIAPLERALRTAWDFLFAPSNAVLEAMRPYEEALEGAFVIAIHIRTGDSAMSPGDKPQRDLESFGERVGRYFACAEALNRTAGPPEEHRVRWFLASDSLELRRAAKRVYGDLLVTNTDTPSMHVSGDVQGNVNLPDATEEALLAMGRGRAVVTSVADLLLLARGDVHVLSHDSGYGRIAAFLSDGVGAHIAWGDEEAKGGEEGGCAARLLTRLDGGILGGYSGVR